MNERRLYWKLSKSHWIALVVVSGKSDFRPKLVLPVVQPALGQVVEFVHAA
jgi:hypothetical protein